ncbi:hypothetical protein NPIL_164281, partial [Nephila pilipes]
VLSTSHIMEREICKGHHKKKSRSNTTGNHGPQHYRTICLEKKLGPITFSPLEQNVVQLRGFGPTECVLEPPETVNPLLTFQICFAANTYN